MAKIKKAPKTPGERQAERDVKRQDRILAEVQDRFVQDDKGNVKPAPVGPSIFDV